MQLYHSWIVVILRTATSRAEPETSDTIFDEHTIDFETMLNVAEAIIQSHHATVTPLLAFDRGVIPPLYFVALKCRVLRLRRKAIDLLKRTPEQEGLWQRETVVRYAVQKNQNEETGRSGVPKPEVT